MIFIACLNLARSSRKGIKLRFLMFERTCHLSHVRSFLFLFFFLFFQILCIHSSRNVMEFPLGTTCPGSSPFSFPLACAAPRKNRRFQRRAIFHRAVKIKRPRSSSATNSLVLINLAAVLCRPLFS